MDYVREITISLCLTVFFLFGYTITQSLCVENVTISVIKSRDIGPYRAVLQGISDYLSKSKINARVTEYSMEGKTADESAELYGEINIKKPDLVLTLGTSATNLAQDLIKDTPIVFTMVLSPEASGISVPGVAMDIPMEAKLVKLKNILPDRNKIGMVYSQKSSYLYQEFSQACGKVGLEPVGREVGSPEEFNATIRDIFFNSDCFFMIPDPKIYFPKSIENLLLEGLKRGVPVIGLSSSYVKAGALLSFECDYRDLGNQSMEFALVVLNENKKPSAMFTYPRKVVFSLNMLVAEKLGIDIPGDIIKEANEVFGR